MRLGEKRISILAKSVELCLRLGRQVSLPIVPVEDILAAFLSVSSSFVPTPVRLAGSMSRIELDGYSATQGERRSHLRHGATHSCAKSKSAIAKVFASYLARHGLLKVLQTPIRSNRCGHCRAGLIPNQDWISEISGSRSRSRFSPAVHNIGRYVSYERAKIDCDHPSTVGHSMEPANESSKSSPYPYTSGGKPYRTPSLNRNDLISSLEPK